MIDDFDQKMVMQLPNTGSDSSSDDDFKPKV